MPCEEGGKKTRKEKGKTNKNKKKTFGKEQNDKRKVGDGRDQLMMN